MKRTSFEVRDLVSEEFTKKILQGRDKPIDSNIKTEFPGQAAFDAEIADFAEKRRQQEKKDWNENFEKKIWEDPRNKALLELENSRNGDLFTSFSVGDVVFLKSDILKKTPLLITKIERVEPQEYLNPLSGETEREFFEPFDQISVGWLTTQKTLAKAEFHHDAICK